MRRIEDALACHHPNPWLKRLVGAVVQGGFGPFYAGNPTLIPCGVPSAPANADGPAALIRGADALVLSGHAVPARDRTGPFAVPGQSGTLWALRGAGAILRGLFGKTAIFSEQRNPGGLPFPICWRCGQVTRCATALAAVAQSLPAKSPKILKCGA